MDMIKKRGKCRLRKKTQKISCNRVFSGGLCRSKCLQTVKLIKNKRINVTKHVHHLLFNNTSC